jgi:hypothetical protein
LDRNSEKVEEGRPLVKMSANWEVVGTWRTRTSPIAPGHERSASHLHKLRPLMLNRVGGEVHSVDIVAVDERALGERAVKLSQELSEPGRLSHAVSNSPVLRLSTRARDNRLSLGRPGDQVATEEDGII